MLLYLVVLFIKNPALVAKYFRAHRKIKQIANQGGIVFVFPCYHVGGAEKVHYRIAQVAYETGYKCSFIFTERSVNNAYLEKFSSLGTVTDLSFRYDNKRVNDKLTEILIKNINGASPDLIFTSNSRYFYGLLQNIKSKNVIDLVHAFNPPFEVKNLDFEKVFHKLSRRIFINNQAMQSMKEHYLAKGLKGTENFELIYNSPLTRITEPETAMQKTHSVTFNVVFVARNSPEKRPEIAFKIAKHLVDASSDYSFHMVGDFKVFENSYANNAITFHYGLNDAEEIIPLYKNAHAIILTSETEGFPLVISEAMFYNVVPVTTDVGGISGVVKNRTNGLLIKSENRREEELVEDFIKALEELKGDQNLFTSLSNKTFVSAKKYFGYESFTEAYEKLFIAQKSC